MIKWDDFDSRSTRVICDECKKDITESFMKGLKKMDFGFDLNIYKRFVRQFGFRLRNWEVSILLYHVSKNPSPLAKMRGQPRISSGWKPQDFSETKKSSDVLESGTLSKFPGSTNQPSETLTNTENKITRKEHD
jgi:hypothetical protein